MGDILFEPQTTGCFCTPESHHRINFHCGAWLYVKGESDPAITGTGKRLIVYSSKCVGVSTTPQNMEGKAPCLFGCPCRTKAGRKQIRAWGIEQEARNEEPGWVVWCRIESVDEPGLCIECRKHRCNSDEDELCDKCFGRNRR